MVSEVPRCQTVKTAVHHDAQLIGDSLWHVQPMEFIVQECRQAAVFFRVSTITRAAALSTRCSLSVTVFGAPA